MPPWEAFQAKSPAQAQVSGPWVKFQPEAAPTDPNAGWQDPGVIVPMQFPKDGNTNGGWPRFSMPQMLAGLGDAASSVTKAATGQYGMEVDPSTGRPTTMTNDMIGDAMSGASLGLTTLSPAASMGAKFGQQALDGPARRIMQRTLAADQIPLNEVGPRLAALGPDAVVADLGPSLQARAAAIATMPGSGQKSVVDALSARRAGANLRITGDVDAALGRSPIPSRVQAEIKANQQALGPEYEAAFKDAAAVDTSGLALDLDSMAVNLRGDAQKAVKRVRQMLSVDGNTEYLDPNPYTLFQTRQAIDGMLGGTTDGNTIRALSMARKQVDDMLAGAVPGIKEVDAKFAELARQSEALQTGQQSLESGRTAPRPQELQDQYAQGALPQGAMVGPSAVPLRLSQGARAEIDRIIGNNVNDVTAMKRIVAGEGNWNRDRLVTAFGEEKAARLLGILEREAKFSATDQLALQGSRTQVLKAAQEDIVGKGPRANPVRSAANFRFGDAAADLADRTLGWIGEGRRSDTNAKIAEALMAQGGSDTAKSLAFRPASSLPSWPLIVRALALQVGQGRDAQPTVLPGPRR